MKKNMKKMKVEYPPIGRLAQELATFGSRTQSRSKPMELAFVAPVSWSTSPVAPPTGIAAPSVQQPGARGAATVAVGAALAAVVAAKRTGRSARRAQEMATLPKQTGPSGKYVLFFFLGGDGQNFKTWIHQ